VSEARARMRDIFESTTSYENWMRKETDVVESHLRHKNAAMKEAFSFS
jgi:hypothetical protein